MRNAAGQILAVARLELGKIFLARRSLWVYLLALAPVVLYLAHAVHAPRERERLARLHAGHPTSPLALRLIPAGVSFRIAVAVLGEPYARRGGEFRADGGGTTQRALYRYTDGRSDYALRFVDGRLSRVNRTDPPTVAGETFVFANIFQFYFLRLAVFFGCLGVFMNLFRGEMLDKSLHFYLLTPLRREHLVVGKFVAGVVATVTIFAAGAALQLPAMLSQFERPAAAAYFTAGRGWHDLAAYLGVTALACVGYGSIFLAAGLFFRNPVAPAAAVLLWESANLFVPPALKHLSLTFYLQSLCPVVPPVDPDMPAPLALLMSGAPPASPPAAVAVVLVFAALVLATAAWKSRTLEINYASD